MIKQMLLKYFVYIQGPKVTSRWIHILLVYYICRMKRRGRGERPITFSASFRNYIMYFKTNYVKQFNTHLTFYPMFIIGGVEFRIFFLKKKFRCSLSLTRPTPNEIMLHCIILFNITFHIFYELKKEKKEESCRDKLHLIIRKRTFLC